MSLFLWEASNVGELCPRVTQYTMIITWLFFFPGEKKDEETPKVSHCDMERIHTHTP